MINLAIFMYTSEMITRSMLLLYTHLRNVAFNTITAIDGKKYSLFIRKHPSEYAIFSSDKHLILNNFKTFEKADKIDRKISFSLQPREIWISVA